jgi:hypothetical protein
VVGAKRLLPYDRLPMKSLLRVLLWAILVAFSANAIPAAPAPFDLAGPVLDVKVTRGKTTLLVSQVPNLASGDRLLLKADFPATQSEHYLMVVAFLRGSTNPPPRDWFFRCQTWKSPCTKDGLTVTVPDGAQQVLIFLAPETSGDFKTLVSAVRGRPGAFVRASQDLNQATLDRSRLDRYLRAIRSLNAADPVALKETTPLLARSLAIKVDEKCLDRLPQLQAPCLMQGQESLILNDGHSMSIVEALTSGPASDLAMAASYTPELNYGYYSPYISSVLDLARLFDSFRVANYQYIPALAATQDDQLLLTLNTPPSFNNPKSVLVASLPAVERAQLPPLHAVNPKDIYCARKNSLVLPVQGAPLVFSTGYAHHTALRLTGKNGEVIELPARADPEQGGFVIDTSPLKTASLGDRIQGALRGYWGFETFDGPSFHFANAHAQAWSPSPNEEPSLIVGRTNTIHLQAGSVACIDRIMVKDPAGKELRVDWTTVKSNEVEINLPLQDAQPGALTVLVSQFGAAEPQPVELRAFPEAGRLESFSMHAGEAQGVLKGSRLDEVVSLSLQGIEFVPAKFTANTSAARLGEDALLMAVKPVSDTPPPQATNLKQGEAAKARVTLRDGRVYNVNVLVTAPRPSVSLLGKSVQLSPANKDSNIQLASEDQVPQDAQLVFSVRATAPPVFDRDEKIEVATDDETFSTTLSLANRSVVLADAKVAVATLDPAKAFGFSAFGPLKFRVIADGVAGDWQKLATLVRLPALQELSCPSAPDLPCKLSGSNLFLVSAVAGDAEFKQSVQVPEGFPGRALPVPHPRNGKLFLKLRDDPSVTNSVALAAQQLTSNSESAPSPKVDSGHTSDGS